MRIFAPFSEEIVRILNEYQDSAEFPYTCVCGSKMRASAEGMSCDRVHLLSTKNFVDVPSALDKNGVDSNFPNDALEKKISGTS